MIYQPGKTAIYNIETKLDLHEPNLETPMDEDCQKEDNGIELILCQGNEKRAYLLIDMQESFLNGIHEDDKDKIIKHQIEVLQYCALHGYPVVVLESSGNGPTIEKLKSAVVAVETHKYITKKYEDGFVDTQLKDILDMWGCKEIYLMGINATACVQSTAKGGRNKGYKIITSDAVIAEPRSWGGLQGRDWIEKNGIYLSLQK